MGELLQQALAEQKNNCWPLFRTLCTGRVVSLMDMAGEHFGAHPSLHTEFTSAV